MGHRVWTLGCSGSWREGSARRKERKRREEQLECPDRGGRPAAESGKSHVGSPRLFRYFPPYPYGTVVVPLRPVNKRYRNSRMIAPITEAMIPGPVPGSEYQPRARPMNPANRAPATPISMVTMIPPGSRPGMISLAIAPTTNPIIKVHRNPIVPSKVDRRYKRLRAWHL